MSKVKTTVTLPSNDLEWFSEAFPDGSISWVLTLLLREFRSIYDNKSTPKQSAQEASNNIKQMIDEGLFK